MWKEKSKCLTKKNMAEYLETNVELLNFATTNKC